MFRALYFYLLLSFSCYSQYIATPLEVNSLGGSFPKNFKAVGNKLFFSAITQSYGRELWVHDLLTGNTNMVKDIRSGIHNSIDNNEFVEFNGKLYFIAFNGMPGLWKSDGTTEGTVLIKSFNDYNDVLPSGLTVCNGKLYFSANTNEDGSEIWISDGTTSGTQILKDINPGNEDSSPESFFSFNNKIYFTAYSPTSGRELWSSDGSPSGTQLVTDLFPGSNSSNIREIKVLNNNFYFFASSNITGSELFKSDGTAQGTFLFKEFVSGLLGVATAKMGEIVDGKLIFFVSYSPTFRQLWKTDGTISGTSILKNIVPSQDNVYYFDHFVKFNNNIYITAGGYGESCELWKTNGTVAGTQIVENLISVGTEIVNINAAENYIIFCVTANNGTFKIFKSNGTNGGTSEIRPGLNMSTTTAGEINFYPIGNKTFFSAEHEVNNNELWSTEGNFINTSQVKDIFHSYQGLYNKVQSINNKLVFMGNDGTSGNEPFVSDGTPEGTFLLSDIAPGEDNGIEYDNAVKQIFFPVNNYLLFIAWGNYGYELYRTDGTVNGTAILKDIAAGQANSLNSSYNFIASYNNVVYFKANDLIHGFELWRTDGTPEGTYMLKDINPGSSSGFTSINFIELENSNYAVENNKLYFIANDGTGNAIWSTDGTSQNTIKVVTTASPAKIIGGANGKIFFITNENQSTYGANTIWSTNGTQAGTTMLKTFNTQESTNFRYACVFNDNIYFNAFNPLSGKAVIAKSDGTVEGTLIIKEFTSQYRPITNLTACEDRVLFYVNHLSGPEIPIWQTDGTMEGTVSITDAISNLDGTSISSFNCLDQNIVLLSGATSIWVVPENGSTAMEKEIEYPIDPNFETASTSAIFGTIGDNFYISGYTTFANSELYTISNEILGLGEWNNDDFESDSDLNVTLVPNPADKIVNIISRNKAEEILVYNVAGQEIYCGKVQNNQVDVSLINNGMYIVKIRFVDGKVSSSKLIKK